jgi:hypothetical protein
MKKMLLTLTAAGLLAVPTGVAIARDNGTTTPDVPATTCQDQDQDRIQDQLRLHQDDPVATQDQERARHQYRIDDGECTADCTGSQAQYRLGEMGRSDSGGPHR